VVEEVCGSGLGSTSGGQGQDSGSPYRLEQADILEFVSQCSQAGSMQVGVSRTTFLSFKFSVKCLCLINACLLSRTAVDWNCLNGVQYRDGGKINLILVISLCLVILCIYLVNGQ
jgi:hypothetical protein